MFEFIDMFWHKNLRRPYKLQHSVQGQGEPLVLLHGLGVSRRKWRPLEKIIAFSKWHVLAPDLLGFGNSPKPGWNNYDISQHAKNVIHLIDKSKLKKPLTIAGHSMGCLVAAHIAVKRPDLVKRLVLYQPPLFAQLPQFPKHTNSTKKHFAFFEYVASRPPLAFLQSRIVRKIYKRIALLEMDDKGWVPFERSLKNTIMNQAAYDELHSINIPTDIIHGRLDIVVTKAELEQMFAHNEKITFHKVTDTHDITNRSAKYILKVLEGVKARKKRSKKTAVVS